MTEHLPVDPPLSYEDARKAAGFALGYSGADDVEVVITASQTGLTRFANSEIIQNTVRNEMHAYVRAVTGRRSATTTTTQLDAEHMRRAASSALEAASASPPDPEWPGLPSPDDVGRAEGLFRYDEATAAASPEARAGAVRKVLGAAGGRGVAGVYETGAHAFAVVSSAGVDCYDAYTRCVVNCLVDNDGPTGWGDASSSAMAEVDVEGVADRARTKASTGGRVGDAEPGVYEVVLEPPAVADLLEYLSYCGMGAKQMLEGESFLSNRSGARVAAPAVTVADDVFHPDSVGIGFDFEGVPKQRVAVIDRGVAEGPVTDWRTARKLGVEPSGHFSGSTEYGPYASHVVLEEGTSSLDELVGGVDDGILVTRFHYVNVLDRPATLLTGMTRDGTFRIRGGEVAEPVHNFRFAQSVLEAFDAVTGVGASGAGFAPDYGSFGSTVAPALRIGGFRFASVTSH